MRTRTAHPTRLGRGAAWRRPTAVVVAGLLLAACSGPKDSDTGASDELVVLSPAQATSYATDGGSTGGPDGAELVMNTQAGLVRNPYVDDEASGAKKQDWYDFEPVLADSYTVSDDGLTYTFVLKKGVTSPGGNELTADDVLWSYERKFASVGSAKFLNDPVITDPAKQIVKVDDYTVAFTIGSRGQGFTLLSLLSNQTGSVYDSDLLKEHVTPDDPYAVKWSMTNGGWGYGAYEVESLTPGEETVLVANPDFVLGEPAISRITYRVVADPGTRANAVLQGDADVATQLRPADQAKLTDDAAAQVFDASTNLFMRMSLITTQAPFDDPQVREAMRYAIPYDSIVKDVYRDRAELSTGMLADDAPGYSNSGLEAPSYDPDRAKQLLAAAGHPDGVDLKLSVSSAVPDAVDAAVAIQSAAKDAGFNVSIDEQPASAFATASTEGVYQAFLARDYSAVMSPPYELSVWTGKGSVINYSRWENQNFYDAVAAGIDAGDPLSDEAGAAWNEAEQVMQSDSPMLFIARVRPSIAFGADLSGYAFRSDNNVDYSQVAGE